MSDNSMLADMAAADDVQSTEVAQTSADKPSWLPEKFNSPAELAKAYSELSKAYSKRSGGADNAAASPSGQADSSPVDSAIPANNDEAQVFVEKAGLNFDSFATEFREFGELSRISYDELAKAGIGREVVDSYVAGQQALADGIRNEIFSAAGDENAYRSMVAWAGSNLSPNEIRAYDAVMGTGDTAQMKLAVDGLRSRYIGDVGSAPKLIGGSSGHGSGTSGDTFSSMKEVTAAMRNEKYATDENYRKTVAEKLGRSNIM